jgi:hypothetical protein
MIDDTLEKRGQRHLIHNKPLRLVEKVKRKVSGSTKASNRDNSKVQKTQPSSSRPKTASNPHFREEPAQPSFSRPKTASDPHFRGVKRDNSKDLVAQPSSSRPNISSDPKTASGPHFLIREGVRSSSIPSSSASAKGWPTATPAPRKRPSDTPDSAVKKKQKTYKYPGCPICGGPHHLVKDCPITAEGPKRYFFLVSDFTTSLLIT